MTVAASPRRRRPLAACVALAVALAAATPSVAAVVTTTPFLGVTHHRIDNATPRPNLINVVVIDLLADGIRIENTLGNGDPTPGTPADENGETNVETTPAYVDRVGAQVAINTTFFNLGGSPNNNVGLLIANGTNLSPNDGGRRPVLNVSQGNVGSVVTESATAGTFTVSPAGTPLYNAVSGSDRIISAGGNVAPADSNVSGAFLNLNPRTAAGISQDGRKLILMTVDGRQAGTSEGMYLREVADVLISYGAFNGLNLDGGGSTTMAMDYYYDAGGAKVVNSTPGGALRAVGANLGVFAKASTPPPPAPPPNLVTIETFATGEGRFTGNSSSSNNSGIVLASTLVTYEGSGGQGDGGGNQKLTITHDPSTAVTGFTYRNLSGGGAPANNLTLEAEGYVGFYLRTTTPGLQASLLVDETGTERGAFRDVIADGAWHLYEWAIDDAAQWENFASGNGAIDAATFSIDAMYLRSTTEQSAVVYFDSLLQNRTGSLAAIPEPASAAALLSLGALGLRRRRGR